MKKVLFGVFILFLFLSASFVLADDISLVVKSNLETKTVKFIAASDTSATISVNGEAREINEGQRKEFGGLVIEVLGSDEENLVISADSLIGVRASLNNTNPQKIVYFDGVEYKAELISASNTASTIRVNSISKEINENTKKDFGNNIYIEIVDAREANLSLSVDLVIFFKKDFQAGKSSAGNNETICTDSDGGINYNVKGQTTLPAVDSYSTGTGFDDKCIDSQKLQEGYCSGNNVETKNYNCPNGCKEGRCIEVSNTTLGNDYDSCLSNPNNYWDQDTDKCYSGYNENIVKAMCSDPDGGENIFERAHTFGFRSSYADDKDKRIRTGGRDGCIEDNTLVEHYCDNNGFIQTSYVKCSENCIEGVCTSEEKNGFKQAYIECHDGIETEIEGENVCLPSSLMQNKAESFCEGRCNKESGKCGVNSFSVSIECHYEGKEIIEKEIKDEKKEIKSPEINDGVSLCKNSCPLDDKCYPFGYRKGGEYCSDKGGFVKQSESNAQCENNFECGSNVCVSGQCVDEGLLKKILNWFKRLFGTE